MTLSGVIFISRGHDQVHLHIDFGLPLISSFFFPFLNSFFQLFNTDFCIAEWTLMDLVFYFRLEPIVNAFGMEEMVADGNLFDWNTFLVFFKADDTFILFELIHSLIITLFLDQGQQLCYSLFYLLLSSSSLVLY